MALRSAQMDAVRALYLLLYGLKKALCVLVGGLEVGVVGVLNVGAGILLNFVKKKKCSQGLVFKYFKLKNVPPV